ncbi:hypothetical protein IMCC3317_01960 [Kordia antarctica]|uniref:Uncharacterized protein n=1 Tax=Kordia antarctica TaxID=1218801 RepID=A0A7L4ZEF8_9FLAO|nr:hypothetical protein [Kordia antarctica]QHI34851.1 hypothetical protein IMCC3317_01960 [Kordia antarctica]
MLHKILNLEGFIALEKKQQQTILGGSQRYCSHRRPCDLPYACYGGICKRIP